MATTSQIIEKLEAQGASGAAKAKVRLHLQNISRW